MMDSDMIFFNDRFLRRQRCFDGASELISCQFDRDNGQVPQLHHARTYVERWDQMCLRGLGLLFWGPPGTGKTFAAACIANYFLESRESFVPTVVMTTLGVVLQKVLALNPQDRDVYLQGLQQADLLILDDFGMERQTEFAREQVFNIINGRYLSSKPMIITTNLTLQQLKSPQTMSDHRISDRVLEVCVPVCFEGESLRKARAAENLRFYRDLAASSC